MIVAGCTRVADMRPPSDEAQYDKLADSVGYGLYRFYDREEGNTCYVYEGQNGSTINCMVSLQSDHTRPQ